MTFLTGLGLFIAGATVGATLAAVVMGAFNANGPCAQDALRYLARLYYLVENANMCDFSIGVTYRNIDEGTVHADRVLTAVRRFLDRWGEGEGV